MAKKPAARPTLPCPTAPPRRRLAEADRLHRALSSVIRPDALGPWLDAPNPAYGASSRWS